MMSNITFDRERDAALRGMEFKPRGAFLAGGAITSTFTNKPIADYDIYFKSRDAFIKAVEAAYDEGLWCVCNTGRAITFVRDGAAYQMMHFAFFPEAQQIFESFDFTCCMAAIDLDENALVFHPKFLADTSRRELAFNHRTAYPIASAMRVLKYQERGYTIKKVELLKVVTACSFKSIEGWDDLAEQIGGRYGRAATIDKTKPFCADAAIESLDGMDLQGSASAEDAPANAEEALAQIFGNDPPREGVCR